MSPTAKNKDYCKTYREKNADGYRKGEVEKEVDFNGT